MSLNTLQGDVRINGELTCENFNCPDAALDNAAISSDANIDASKLMHRIYHNYQQPLGSNIANATILAHIGKYAGNLVGVHACLTTTCSGGDTVVINVLKSTAGGAFATVLTGNLTLNSSTTVRTVYDASIASDSYIADDIFEIAITGTNSSAQGLMVQLVFEENGA